MPNPARAARGPTPIGVLAPVLAALGLVAALGGCSSTASTTGVSSGSTRGAIPAAAFHDYTGITPSSVTVANISTQTGGLFTGAVVGTKAYAAYVNSQGGINGRKLVVDSADDNFEGATNKDLTEAAVENDFATVGSFSLEDSFGGAVLAANPQVPNVSLSLDAATADLPNTFSTDTGAHGWPLGALAYFKRKFPTEIAHTGTLTSAYSSALVTWGLEKAAMIHLGYKVVYSPSVPVTQTDFTQDVIGMRNAGVKLLYIDQLPENYASSVVTALNQQDFHPILVIGTSAYSEALVPNSGGAAAIDGAYLEQPTSLFLGEDAGGIPAIGTFLTWVQKESPGFQPDFYTLTGWLCAELFSQALRAAGDHPSRGSVLESLRKITSFSGGNIVASSDPSNRIAPTCYVIARIVNGTFQRLDDPPIDGPTHGYRCDEPFYDVPG
jgi:ABC-type branched-subunit amino acid transport system substrate-binding protein